MKWYDARQAVKAVSHAHTICHTGVLKTAATLGYIRQSGTQHPSHTHTRTHSPPLVDNRFAYEIKDIN